MHCEWDLKLKSHNAGRRVIRLSQWFITLCLWQYSISFTKKSCTSITVIYHTMSLIAQYQFH